MKIVGNKTTWESSEIMPEKATWFISFPPLELRRLIDEDK